MPPVTTYAGGTVARRDESTPLLDYSPPVARQRRPVSASGRLLLAVGLAVAHFSFGYLAVSLAFAGPFINAVMTAFLFPFGLIASGINPHRLLEAAIGNSIFCGFVIAYAYAFWRNRKRQSR